jgi:colanic acid/amylovoran biosynthesis protein
MEILLQGAGTNNKGAELMLYAVLQEIERSFPSAVIYLGRSSVPQGRKYLQSKTDIRLFTPPLYWSIINKLRINVLLKKLHLSGFLVPNPPSHHIDYLFDLSGLLFSDQMNLTENKINRLSEALRKYSQKGTKIVYLPQAFGPTEKKNTKNAIKNLSKYATLVFARENKSYEYLMDSNLIDMNKVKKCTDFTSLVKGVFPNEYSHLKGTVCIIPNRHMIDRGGITFGEYVEMLRNYISAISNGGRKAFFLNHEGKNEETFINKIISQLDFEIEMVSGLNALETKGIISESYMVISSRFHGVASALNSCVPCLATSWNHKYSYLFKDYNMQDCVLSQMSAELSRKKIEEFMDSENNMIIREQLELINPTIQQYAKDMWSTIWKLKKQ